MTIPMQPENELEGVMVQVAAGARDEDAFFARLWESELLVPQEGDGSEGAPRELPAVPGAELPLPVLPVRGARAVPVYSSEAQLRKVAPPEWSAFVRLPMPALQAMLAGSGAGLVINPGGDLSTLLDPAQVAALPERHPAASPVPSSANVAELEVVDAAVVEFCRSRPEIRAAYGALVDGRPVVGLVLSEGSPAVVLSAAADELAGVAELGMLVIDEASPGAVAERMLASGAPFYER